MSSRTSSAAGALPEERDGERGTCAVRADGLVKRFGRKTVLDGLDWRIPEGRVVGLIGRNGAGKTTLLRCLLGLSPLDAGAVRIFGRDAQDLDGAMLHRIGYVPQTFDLFPWMKVGRYLAFSAAFYGRWDRELAARLTDAWGIDPGKRISELSVGQRQILALARALAPDPDLLVLDEPVASLDPAARRMFVETLRPHLARGNKTVVLSTHIVRDLERLGADLALLREGRIALTLADERVRTAALAVLRRPGGVGEVPGGPAVLASRREGDEIRLLLRAREPAVEEDLAARARALGATLDVRAVDLEDLFVAFA